MTITHYSFGNSSEKEEEQEVSAECKELLLSLPKERGWRTSHLYFYQGFWCQPLEIQAIISFQKHFVARDNDLILVTIPKSGTTWLKALVFTVLNRGKYKTDLGHRHHHPLLSANPHDLVPFFEYKLYANNQLPSLSSLSDPRTFATHIPFESLPNSIKNYSNCKIVYMCRNPFDTFISSWHYLNRVREQGGAPPFPREEGFDMFCRGVVGFGPFWDHMLGYWKESLESPQKVFFLKYEDLKEDTHFHLNRLAAFLGQPFSKQEDDGGVVEEIVEMCSFEKMKNLEVNKKGKSIKNFENKFLFRKGEVGDWVNYLSPEMVERLSWVMEEKLGGTGLRFKLFPSQNQ